MASRKGSRYGIQPTKSGYSPLNTGYSPLNAVTAALPLNVLAGDLKPWVSHRRDRGLAAKESSAEQGLI